MAIVVGTEGDDTILVGSASPGVVPPTGATDLLDSIQALAGTDTVAAGGGGDSLDGGPGGDTLAGGRGGDDYFVDNLGDRVVEIASSIDPGVDRVESTVSFTLPADVENLTLRGTENITGTGNAQANVITGNNGNNFLSGLGGGDSLDGGPGGDTLAGGRGSDAYFVDNLGDRVSESAGVGTGIDVVESTVSFTLPDNVENLILRGTENITGTGNALNNLVITGNNGNNFLSGLGGNDSLNGGIGSDTLLGGTENDNYFVDNLGDRVIEGAGAGTDTVESTVSFTLPDNVENLTLRGTENITGTGNALANRITGNNGNNTPLNGLGGNDSLDGGPGLDILDGGPGNDILDGGPGGDALIGQAGDDTYDFNAVSAAPAGGGEAVLGGFSGVEGIGAVGGDVFDLRTIDANTLVADNQPFTFIGTAAFSGAAGQLRVANAGSGNTLIQGNINGDLVPDLEILVQDGSTSPGSYIAGDFFL